MNKKTMNTFMQELKAGKMEEYGKFDGSDIASQFIPYFESEERVKVKFSYGEIKSGKIGITTGWKPVFILMLTSRSIGSSHTLSKKDKIIAVAEPKTSWKYGKEAI